MACDDPPLSLSALLDENDAYDQPSSELRADCVLAAGRLASDQLGATVPMQHSPAASSPRRVHQALSENFRVSLWTPSAAATVCSDKTALASSVAI